MDLSVRVVSINKGYNLNIIQNSNNLNGYVEFMSMVRDNQQKGMTLQDAVKKAISDCVQLGILVDFLNRHGSEVLNMLITEFNIDIAKRVWQEEAREEGIEEGIDIGLIQGLINAAVNAIKNRRISLTDALDLVELDTTYREKVISKLKEQGIEYTE